MSLCYITSWKAVGLFDYYKENIINIWCLILICNTCAINGVLPAVFTENARIFQSSFAAYAVHVAFKVSMNAHYGLRAQCGIWNNQTEAHKTQENTVLFFMCLSSQWECLVMQQNHAESHWRESFCSGAMSCIFHNTCSRDQGVTKAPRYQEPWLSAAH